jgi:hypothetical protein
MHERCILILELGDLGIEAAFTRQAIKVLLHGYVLDIDFLAVVTFAMHENEHLVITNRTSKTPLQKLGNYMLPLARHHSPAYMRKG